MKKYLFILGLVGTALFTACSSADDLVKTEIPSQGLTEEEKALIVEAGQDSDVPITLGTVANSRAMTRTPIEPEIGTTLFTTPANQYLGVFCLAQGKQAGAPSIVPDDGNILWNSSDYAMWLNNVPAIVSKHTASTVSPIDGGFSLDYSYVQFMKDIDSSPAVKIYYYPFGNWYYYDFYAYYPRQASGNVWVGQGRVVVSYTITGKEDIIWARAIGGTSVTDPVTSNSVKSYSAKYMRLSKEDLDGNGSPDHTEFEVVPGLAFDHKLTQFVFSVKPHFEDRVELNTKGYRVTKMEVIDVYNQLELYAADKTGGDHGALKIKNLSTTDNILVRNTDGSDDLDDTPTPVIVATDGDAAATDVAGITTKEIGYALLPTSDMLTAAGYTNQYLVSIEMEQKDETGKYPGEDGYSGDPVPNTIVTLPLPTGGKYEAGKKYSITLEIYNPTNIQATATLVGWGDPVVIPAIPVE